MTKLHTHTHNCFTAVTIVTRTRLNVTFIRTLPVLFSFLCRENNSLLSAYFVRFIEVHFCLRFSCSIHLSSEVCDKYRLAPKPCILFYLVKGYRLICVINNADRIYFWTLYCGYFNISRLTLRWAHLKSTAHYAAIKKYLFHWALYPGAPACFIKFRSR